MSAYVQIRVGDDTFDYTITNMGELSGVPEGDGIYRNPRLGEPASQAEPMGLFRYRVVKHSPGQTQVIRYFDHTRVRGLEECIIEALRVTK